MGRIHLVLIWCVGRLGELQSAGLVEGVGYRVADGAAAFEELKRQSFIPDSNEIRCAFGAMDIPAESHDDLLKLMVPSY